MCPCQSAECGPVQLFETDKNLKKNKKKRRARTSARADISVRKEEEKDLQQKLIGRYINAISSPMLSMG